MRLRMQEDGCGVDVGVQMETREVPFKCTRQNTLMLRKHRRHDPCTSKQDAFPATKSAFRGRALSFVGLSHRMMDWEATLLRDETASSIRHR